MSIRFPRKYRVWRNIDGVALLVYDTTYPSKEEKNLGQEDAKMGRCYPVYNDCISQLKRGFCLNETNFQLEHKSVTTEGECQISLSDAIKAFFWK
jgi:hypothetical protein